MTINCQNVDVSSSRGIPSELENTYLTPQPSTSVDYLKSGARPKERPPLPPYERALPEIPPKNKHQEDLRKEATSLNLPQKPERKHKISPKHIGKYTMRFLSITLNTV